MKYANHSNSSHHTAGWWWLWIPKSVGRASVRGTPRTNSNHSTNSISDRKSRSLRFTTLTIHEERKLVNSFDAFNLNREGYWGCINCTTHNLDNQIYCTVCAELCWKKMPTELLSPGRPISILQNVAYALPVSRCFLYCDTAAATLFQSATPAFTLSNALTLDANKQIEVSGGFLKLTSAGPVNIVLKKT